MAYTDFRVITETGVGALSLWFGTDGDLSRFHQGTRTTFTKTDDLANNKVQPFNGSTSEASWLKTIRLKHDKPHLFIHFSTYLKTLRKLKIGDKDEE